MNDLLEKALDGAAVAYRGARSRVLVTAGVVGFVLAAAIVVAGGRVGAALSTQPLTSWFGLQETYGIQATDPVPGAVLLTATVALLAVWAVTVEVVRRRRLAARGVWWVFAAWAAPFAVGPPLFDPGVYSYVAFGLVQRAGRDPYDVPPGGLGYARIVEAVDPDSRGTTSSAGALGTLLQHVAASVGVGNALLMVVVLRVLAVVAAVWIGRTAVELGSRTPGPALALTALNPLLLFFVVSSCRLEGVAAALAVTAVATAARRSWRRAMLLAGTAGSVLVPVLVLVPALIAAHLTVRRRPPSATVLVDLVVAAVPVAVFGFAVRDGFGWVRNVRDQFTTHTPFSVADATGRLLSPIVRDASYDTLAASARSATTLALLAAVVALLVTARRRPVDRTAGYCLLAVGLLAPTLHPWYLVAGLVCLAPRADGQRGVWLTGLSAAACLLVPGGFGPAITDAVTGVSLAVTAAVTFALARRRSAAARDVADGGADVGEVDGDEDERDQRDRADDRRDERAEHAGQ